MQTPQLLNFYLQLWLEDGSQNTHCLTVSSSSRFCYIYSYSEISVVQLSDDGKKVLCKPCHAATEKTEKGWMRKDSLPNHLKSISHAKCLSEQEISQSIQRPGDCPVEEESAMEETMDFVTFTSIAQSSAAAKEHIPRPTDEEGEMWDDLMHHTEIFDAGVDHTLDAAEERKRLEREATEFDLWHDSLPEQDFKTVLDELEQEDVLSELLQNARTYSLHFYSGPGHLNDLISGILDLNQPDAADLLNEELGDTRQPQTDNAWFPYESKMVS